MYAVFDFDVWFERPEKLSDDYVWAASFENGAGFCEVVWYQQKSSAKRFLANCVDGNGNNYGGSVVHVVDEAEKDRLLAELEEEFEDQNKTIDPREKIARLEHMISEKDAEIAGLHRIISSLAKQPPQTVSSVPRTLRITENVVRIWFALWEEPNVWFSEPSIRDEPHIRPFMSRQMVHKTLKLMVEMGHLEALGTSPNQFRELPEERVSPEVLEWRKRCYQTMAESKFPEMEWGE